MLKQILAYITNFLLLLAAVGLGALLSRMAAPSNTAQLEALATNTPTAESTIVRETIPPYTPLPTLTPSQTLKPPPTFEPPTPTLPPSPIPSQTPVPTIDLSVSIPGLHGAETATPSSTPGCVPRKDWTLIYEVQSNDALAHIAGRYNTTVDALAQANCIRDPNLIVVGQKLRVPGEAHPEHQPQYDCAWEVLTPFNGAVTIPGSGQLTFNWHGPRAVRNLIRIIKPDGGLVEILVELRQNETIDLREKLPDAGTYTWYVFPLDENFIQIPCKEGGPWTFTKEAAE